MSAASRQNHRPYPRGSAFGTVPVLFSLRNVQPKIFADTNSSTVAAPAAPGIQTPDPVMEALQSKPSATLDSKVTTGIPAPRTNETSNRIYNGAIGLLVLALVLLVIRNSQNASSRSLTKNETKASENAIEPTSKLIPIETNETAVAVSSNSSQVKEDRPFDVAPMHATLELGSNSNEGMESHLEAIELGAPLDLAKPSSEIASVTLPKLLMEEKGMTSLTKSMDEPTQLASKPPIQPMLLDASQSKPSNAKPSATNSNSSAVALPNSSSSQTFGTSLVDTGEQLPIDLLIELHNKNNSNASSMSVANAPKAAPVSYPTYVPESAMQGSPMLSTSGTAQMLTGQTYPPMAPDYKPMTVPAYERNAVANTMRGNMDAAPGFVRQPSSKPSMHPNGQTILDGSNRYQGTPIQKPDATGTKLPYSPYLAPFQPNSANPNNNSMGYPPSN